MHAQAYLVHARSYKQAAIGAAHDAKLLGLRVFMCNQVLSAAL